VFGILPAFRHHALSGKIDDIVRPEIGYDFHDFGEVVIQV